MQSYLLCEGTSSVSPHVEDNILKRSSLSDLPMNTSSNIHRHSCEIDNEIADLAEEIILVGVPIDSPIGIWVWVEKSNTSEVWKSLDSGNRNCVANKLCVIELDNGFANPVCSRGEVDKSGSDRRWITSLTTTSTSSNSSVDSYRIIGRSCSSS